MISPFIIHVPDLWKRSLEVHSHRRIGPPSHHRSKIRYIHTDDLIINGIVITNQSLPICYCGLKIIWHTFASPEVVKGRLIWIHDPHFGPELDRHVTDGHAFFHGQAINCFSPILYDITNSTSNPVARYQS